MVQVSLLEDLPHRLPYVRGRGLDGGLVHNLLEVDVHLVTEVSFTATDNSGREERRFFLAEFHLEGSRGATADGIAT